MDVSLTDMMSEEQVKVIKMVYCRFMENETEDWSKVDEVLELLGLLSDDELIRETEIRYMEHCRGVLRCNQDHDSERCFAPYILESVEIILELYGKTKKLHPKNAYILTYYLAMSDFGLIYSA